MAITHKGTILRIDITKYTMNKYTSFDYIKHLLQKHLSNELTTPVSSFILLILKPLKLVFFFQ